MNVLFITHCTPMDGGNHSLLHLMLELKKPPYSITPILLTPLEIKSASSSILKEAESNGIKCISSRFYPFKYESRSIPNFIRYSSNAINIQRIYRKIKDLNIDLIHSNSSIFDIGAILSKKLDIPHIWHLREFGDLDFNLYPLFGTGQERSTYNHADRFIAISESVKKRFTRYIDPAKIDVIYNGIAADGTIRQSAHNNDTIRFCITGAINKTKRQGDAIEAFNLLVNGRGYRNLHLYIIGEGKDRTMLESIVRSHGLETYVTFLGWMKDPVKQYADMDSGLMLSTNEAFGRVTIEYMRANLVVIASDGGANKELVNDGETGILFETGNIQQLADKIAFVIDHFDIAKGIAEKGWKFSQTHFLSKDNTKAIYNTYLKYGIGDRQH